MLRVHCVQFWHWYTWYPGQEHETMIRQLLAVALVVRGARADDSMQTDCSSPPIPWVDIHKSFWEKGYAIISPCAFAGESSLLDAVQDYAVAGCAWAEAARAGKNFPGMCPRKTNQWRTVASIHDAAVSEETRKMIAYIHNEPELPFPYQTITRTAPAIIKPHSDVVFWDTLPRARSVGTWLALEDIHEDSGPLEVYPKSHHESLWDSYELGLPCAAKAISNAIASASDNRHGFLKSRPNGTIPVPNLPVPAKPRSKQAAKSCGGATCEYFDVMERLFSNRTKEIPSLKRGQMLLWAASLVHQSLPPRNRSLTRQSFITHYMWNTKAYWRPTESNKKVHYVPKTMMQIPVAPYRSWPTRGNQIASQGVAQGADHRRHERLQDHTHSMKHKAQSHLTKPTDIAALSSETARSHADAVVTANWPSNRSVFVVGASRGVGLALAKVYAASGYTVHATTRTLNEPGELGKIPGVRLHQLDVLEPSDIEAIRAKAETGVLGAISTVIHNAAVKTQNLTQCMLINSQAPFLVADALLPAVLRSEERKLCIITSDMASHEVMLHQKPSRKKWPYTISKQAANQRFRELEPHWRAHGVCAVVIHPGFVKTDMSGGFGDLTPLESATFIKRTLERITRTDAGTFFAYNGKVLPW